MNNKLTNYAEWSIVFDQIESWQIGSTDSQTLKDIENGEIKWVLGTADRFIKRLLDLINIRFKKLNDFYKERCSACYSTFEFQKLLICFRKELIFLKQLSNIKVLPEEIKIKLTEDIMNFAQNVQKNLETNSKKDLTGEMQRIVLENRIDRI